MTIFRVLGFRFRFRVKGSRDLVSILGVVIRQVERERERYIYIYIYMYTHTHIYAGSLLDTFIFISATTKPTKD